MAFEPYDIYDARLPKLKPGFFFEIAGKFYQVMVVRSNRQEVDDARIDADNSTDPGLILNTTTNNVYEALHGNIGVGRVIQIQYISAETALDVLLKWGTEPLFSKWRNITINSNFAGLAHPMQVDRWSYSVEMRMSVIKDAGDQDLWFEIVEYEVIQWTKEPPRRYLKILANGQAVFVEAG